MKTPIHIILVEDNPEYREVIKIALEDESDLEISHEFGTSEIALRSLQEDHLPNRTDVVLLDLRLPGMDGLEALPWFKQYAPEAKVIILTQSEQEADVLKAIEQGASGYLLKSSSAAQITEGIRTVIQGGAALDTSIAMLVMNNLQARLPKDTIKQALSKREIEILKLLSQGKLKKEIGGHLSISYATVDSHVQHIYQKLEVKNAPSAIHKAHRLGLLPDL